MGDEKIDGRGNNRQFYFLCGEFEGYSSYWTHESQQPTSPIGFLSLKLPPPPCAVLLVTWTDAVGVWKWHQ